MRLLGFESLLQNRFLIRNCTFMMVFFEIETVGFSIVWVFWCWSWLTWYYSEKLRTYLNFNLIKLDLGWKYLVLYMFGSLCGTWILTKHSKLGIWSSSCYVTERRFSLVWCILIIGEHDAWRIQYFTYKITAEGNYK